MTIATVSWIPSNIEPAFWGIIFIICAYLIARICSEKYFLNGLLVSLVNSVWITSAHIIFLNTYLIHHPDQSAMLLKMPIPDSPRLMMVMTGPIIGAVSGLFLGLFSFIASKILRKK